MQKYKQPVSVLVVIYTAALEVLLLERADYAGLWQSVTGSCEAGETLVQTAAREVREETGIDVSQHKLSDRQLQNVYEIYPQWRYRYAPDIAYNTEHVFGLQLNDRCAITLSPREHLNHAWYAWQDAADKVFSPSNREAILRLPENNRMMQGISGKSR